MVEEAQVLDLEKFAAAAMVVDDVAKSSTSAVS
jgi:hypothetical protein